jgi:hypothetical protein
MGKLVLCFLAGALFAFAFSPYIFPKGFAATVEYVADDIANRASSLFH